MRPATPGLKAAIEAWSPATTLVMADLYTFTLVGGETLRYSGFTLALDAPAPNTTTPKIHYPLGPRINRTKCTIKVGVEVDELEISVLASTEEIVIGGAITWQRSAKEGLFDGAYCELQRAFLTPTASNPLVPYTVVGTATWFYGRVGDIDIGRTTIKMKIKSELDRLTIQMPRRLFQASCTFIFGDKMCLFDRETMSANITAEAGTDDTVIFSSLSATPSTLYDNGTVISTSGNNNGFSRTISRFTDGQIHFLKPWVFPIGPGDTFHLLPGCDHTLDTCTNVFNNRIHFGGFPFIPPPETAV